MRGGDPDARFDALRALNRVTPAHRGLVRKRFALACGSEIEGSATTFCPRILAGAEDPRIGCSRRLLESADRASTAPAAARLLLSPAVAQRLPVPEFEASPKAPPVLKVPAAPPAAAELRAAARRLRETESADETIRAVPNDGQVAGCIEQAYAIGDAWLRACAVRAAHALAGRVEIAFPERSPESPLVEEELAVAHAVPERKEAP